MTTKTTGSFNNNTTPPVDAQYLNIQRDEMNALCVIDGTTLDSSGLDNSQQAQAVKAYVSQAGILCTDSGSSANSYILTASSPFTNPPLKTGTRVRFKTANANTGSSTITPFGGSAITCKKSNGSTDLTTGDIPANTEVEFVYNGTNFVQSLGKVPATTTTQGVAYLSNPITISNNALDANNDIDFSVGVFQFSDGSGQAVATAIMTKRLDATWSAGTNQGGLLNGTAVPKAINSTYHCYKIYNPTSGVEDSAFLLGVSGTAPDPTSVLPSGFTKFKRVGSVLTDGSGNIRAFTQINNFFKYFSGISDVNTGFVAGSTTPTVSTPLGIIALGIFNIGLDISSISTGNSIWSVISDFNQTSSLAIVTTRQATINVVKIGSFTNVVSNPCFAFTNLASKVKIFNNENVAGTTLANISLLTHGFIDINL